MPHLKLPASLVAHVLHASGNTMLDLPPLNHPHFCTLLKDDFVFLPQPNFLDLDIGADTGTSPATLSLKVRNTTHQIIIDARQNQQYTYTFDCNLPEDHPLLQLLPSDRTLYQTHTLSLPETHQLIFKSLPPSLHETFAPHIQKWQHPFTVCHFFNLWPKPAQPFEVQTMLAYSNRTPHAFSPSTQFDHAEHQNYHPFPASESLNQPLLPDIHRHLFACCLLPLLPPEWVPAYLQDIPDGVSTRLKLTPLDPTEHPDHIWSAPRNFLCLNLSENKERFAVPVAPAQLESSSSNWPLSDLVYPEVTPTTPAELNNALHNVLQQLHNHRDLQILEMFSC